MEMKASCTEIQKLLKKPFDELLIDLANSDGVVQFGASEGNEESGIGVGRAELTDIIVDLREKLCERVEIKEFIRSNSESPSDNVLLVVLDVVLSSVGIAPFFVVTALITKFGLKKICKGELPESSAES